MSLCVIGIDPGLASMGWGVVSLEGSRILYVAHGAIKTDSELPLDARLSIIRTSFSELLKQYKPNAAAMESLFFSRNVTSALNVAEACGVIRLACYDAGLHIHEHSPNNIKKAATGSARSGKGEVQSFVQIVLGLSSIPKPNHSADALAIAICHCQLLPYMQT